MVLLNRSEQAEVLGGCAKDAGVLFGFIDLFSEFRFSAAVAVAAGLSRKLRIHGGEFVGFTLDRQFQATAQHSLFLCIAEFADVVDHQLGMEQAEVGKGVFCLLGGGVAKQLRQFAVAELFGDVGKKQLFAVGHALATEGGFEIGVGRWRGEIHGNPER